MVVILENLDACLEFVDLRLHKLLSVLCEQGQVEFDMSSFHDLLSELNRFLFAILNNLPELVREDITSLMKLFLGSIVFPQVRVFIGEIVEVLHKFVKNCLFPIVGMQVVEEIPCCVSNSFVTLLALHANVSEDELHLSLVVFGEVLPELNDDWLEITVEVVAFRGLWDHGFLASITTHGAKT